MWISLDNLSQFYKVSVNKKLFINDSYMLYGLWSLCYLLFVWFKTNSISSVRLLLVVCYLFIYLVTIVDLLFHFVRFTYLKPHHFTIKDIPKVSFLKTLFNCKLFCEGLSVPTICHKSFCPLFINVSQICFSICIGYLLFLLSPSSSDDLSLKILLSFILITLIDHLPKT